MPIRHQITRGKGSKFPAGAKVVHRGTGFGNPFRIGIHGTREQCVRYHARLAEFGMVRMTHPDDKEAQRAHVEEQRRAIAYLKKNLHKLTGHDVACMCSTAEACHGDTLLRLANPPTCEEVTL